jgi:fibronectin-binding autotransporter adhesin
MVLCDGNDEATISGGITIPCWLYGGGGSDRLKGGNGNNVLVGGAGDDLLVVGGADHDILIGGVGADRIVGNAADDILIAGTSAFDANEAALCAILAEWTSGRSYAARVANLQSTGTGSDFANRKNANHLLHLTDQAATTTVFDEDSEDRLTGDTGMDWFFANLFGSGVRDRIIDLSAVEFADDLTFIQVP